jgi:hypothetical protein
MTDAAQDLDMGLDLVTIAGQPAVYTPPNGAPVTTVCYLQQGMAPQGDGSRLEHVRIAHLPKAHVPEPLRGGLIAIGAASWLVDALEDDDGSVVTVTVRPA